jgi:hypothetical protein
MATRACIGRPIADVGFSAVSLHWDGYPTGLGAALWSLYLGHFERNVVAMTTFLIDEHPAGWSQIVGADFTQPIGFGLPTGGPACYCHGQRSEGPNPIEVIGGEADGWWDLEWAYVLHPQGMDVLEQVTRRFEHRAFIPWSGPEPDWQAIEDGAALHLELTHG